MKLLISSASKCSQDFEYKCAGSVLTNYQCVNSGANPINDFGHNPGQGHSHGSYRCDLNSGSHTDTGTFTKGVLPIAQWLPGDIGDSGEHGELVLKQLTCSA